MLFLVRLLYYTGFCFILPCLIAVFIYGDAQVMSWPMGMRGLVALVGILVLPVTAIIDGGSRITQNIADDLKKRLEQ